MFANRSARVAFFVATLVALTSTSFAGVVEADLSITKTDGAATATPGSSVVYTITASNAGASDVSGATVADTFPAILTCSWTCAASAGSSCTASGTGNINDSVNLLNGGTATYTATCSIAPSATGSLVNTATISSAVTDPNSANNSATDTDTLTASADLSITKTDGDTTYTPGTSTTYTITASNAGPSDVSGATVADTFPAILTCSWTCAASAGSSCTASGTGNINDSVNLLSGGTATYTATCSIAPSATGSLVNTATISSAVTDPNSANNSATDTDTLTASADLSMTAVVTPDPVVVGNMFTIDMTVTNAGPSDAPGVTVTTALPAFATSDSTSGCAEDPNGDPTCTLGTIPAGQMASFTMTATANSVDTGSMEVTVASAVSDPDRTNNSETAVIAAQEAPGIPAAGPVGLALMALLLVCAGVWVLRR